MGADGVRPGDLERERNGETVDAGTVTTNAGVARFQVPLHAAFALTTLPVS